MTLPADDFALPFAVEGAAARGRIVRLGAVAQRVIDGHGYRGDAARLSGEALAIVSLLGTSLKFDGTLTLQTRGSGRATMVAADYQTPGHVRSFVSVDADAEPDAPLLGEGSFALTIDPAEGANRYQGIVDLHGSLTEAALGYFEKSEQIPTKLRIFVGQVQVPGGEPQWRAGGIILQRVAGEGGIQPFDADDDDWRRFGAYLDTVGADELLDPTLAAEDLLYRLFNEDGVRVFAPQPIAFQCRCSAERVENILKSYTAEELADLKTDDGRIEAKCEFCGTIYPFDPAKLATAGEQA
ncbi:33 kDa chaperonin [Alphaproteobacteria bacterium SO-S41]|nr:33 kDa chaperonin [Alphaproteobacteria bacterium SO-S41]